MLRTRLPQLLLFAAFGLLALESRAPAEVILQYGNDFVVDKSRPSGSSTPDLFNIDTSYRLTIFLNFDGADLTSGGNDSRTNKTSLLTGSTLSYPAQTWDKLGGRTKAMKDIVDELKILYSNYAVEFVTTRPTSGDYTMAMIGGTGAGTQGQGSAIGIAPLDCKNSTKNDLCLIFGEKIGSSTKQIAFVIAHELGHTFGLEHVDEAKDIMYASLSSQTCCWTSSKVTSGSCGRTTQDASKVLTDNLGVGEGDTVPPLVFLVRPGEGAVLPSNFTFEVSAVDDLRVHHVTLYLDGTKKFEFTNAPYKGALTKLEDGEHTLKAEAYDWKPNMVSVEAKVTVDSKCVVDGTCQPGVGGLGAPCTSAASCTSGICAKDASEGACAELCSSSTKLCPTGLSCELAGEEYACVKGTGFTLERAAVGEGGCSFGGRSGGAGPWLLLLALLVLAVRRRSWSEG